MVRRELLAVTPPPLGHSAKAVPDASVAGQRFFGGLGAVFTRGIALHAGILLPGIEERLYGTPAVLDVVGALEQRLVAGQS